MSKADWEKAQEIVMEDLDERIVCDGRKALSEFVIYALDTSKDLRQVLDRWVYETEDGKRWLEDEVQETLEDMEGNYIESEDR